MLVMGKEKKNPCITTAMDAAEKPMGRVFFFLLFFYITSTAVRTRAKDLNGVHSKHSKQIKSVSLILVDYVCS